MALYNPTAKQLLEGESPFTFWKRHHGKVEYVIELELDNSWVFQDGNLEAMKEYCQACFCSIDSYIFSTYRTLCRFIQYLDMEGDIADNYRFYHTYWYLERLPIRVKLAKERFNALIGNIGSVSSSSLSTELYFTFTAAEGCVFNSSLADQEILGFYYPVILLDLMLYYCLFMI